MRVSFNIDPVFFKFKEDEVLQGPDLNTIEGVLLESYLDQFNLSVKWIDEEGFWGTRDENGTFNGVVGRVRIASLFSLSILTAKCSTHLP